MTGKKGRRLIPRQHCTWCGHPPHAEPCPATIRTTLGKPGRYGPCPCARAARRPST